MTRPTPSSSSVTDDHSAGGGLPKVRPKMSKSKRTTSVVDGAISSSSGHKPSSSSSQLSGASGRKHGTFGLGFSLRRLLNPAQLTRTMTSAAVATAVSATSGSSSKASRNALRLDNGSSGHGNDSHKNNSHSSKQTPSLCPTYYSSCDFESNSISSGRSATVPVGGDVDTVASGSGTGRGHPVVRRLSQATSSLTYGPHTECPLCLLELPADFFPELSSCTHRACYDCLQQYLKIEISESRVNVSCPECTEPIHPNDIRTILNDENYTAKYEKFMLRRVLVAEPDARWCPAPDCGYVVIAAGCAGCPKLQCKRPGCDTFFCYHCKYVWHPNQTCDAARNERNIRMTPSRMSADFDGHSISNHHRDTDIKPCPTCKVLIIKMDDGSCNHMTCSVCGTEFCWLCMKQISDLHYLSPSGCTFWGKKPWSRKKKILWQLGMLVGAPVGIALIAGIAVPAIIIGIPVWIGRKLHARFERQSMSRHKKNLLVTSGVVSSILVSPIMAAVAVGIGVPILLAYVYGVVPISLCRSGGCGTVYTSASGVKIEFDEEAEIGGNNSSNPAADGLSVDTALSAKPNPSIGEMSYGMSASISMGSGSHLDRVGADRESSSNAAMAGSIASASNSNKLEVQADISSNKRFSVSSGHSETASATVSFSERSANFDDSSIRALAGSIVGNREGASSAAGGTSIAGQTAMTPVEVHYMDTLSVTSATVLEDTQQGTTALKVTTNTTKSNDTVINVDAPIPSSGRCVSFQPASGGAAKSRSYELLTSFCEVCQSSHRTCCPNFSPVPTSGTNSSKSVMKDIANNKTNNSQESSRRKSSVKSTASDSSSSSKKRNEKKATFSDLGKASGRDH